MFHLNVTWKEQLWLMYVVILNVPCYHMLVSYAPCIIFIMFSAMTLHFQIKELNKKSKNNKFSVETHMTSFLFHQLVLFPSVHLLTNVFHCWRFNNFTLIFKIIMESSVHLSAWCTQVSTISSPFIYLFFPKFHNLTLKIELPVYPENIASFMIIWLLLITKCSLHNNVF